MSRIAAARVLLAFGALVTLAACAAPTAPAPSRLRAPGVSRDVGDSTCRSGWTQSDGFKCGPQ